MQGSTGNVIAALCSFFIPGLGQLVQGRVFTAVIHLIAAGAIWLVSFGTMGWIVNIWSTVDAARFRA